jgi:hypothetical protein
LRNIWRLLDLGAAAICLLGIFYLPFLLIILFGAILTSPAKNIANSFLPFVGIMLSGIGGTLAIASLVIVALVPPAKICTRKLFKGLVIVGLVIGIFTAIYYLQPGKGALQIAGVDFFWIASYAMVSAIIHIVELARIRIGYGASPII